MKKILVVEDDMFIRDITSQKLIAHGYEVDVAECGAIALEKLEQVVYDVLLIDIELGDMTGYEILQQQRVGGKNQNTKAIIFSNRDEDMLRDKFTQLGIAGYFVKASTEYSEVFACIDSL